jgi:hypothetical protein
MNPIICKKCKYYIHPVRYVDESGFNEAMKWGCWKKEPQTEMTYDTIVDNKKCPYALEQLLTSKGFKYWIYKMLFNLKVKFMNVFYLEDIK